MTAPIRGIADIRGEAALVSVRDTFAETRAAGRVIGTRTADGALRYGSDAEGQIAIDHGALRFQPLATPGWGRQGIAYGPFKRVSGLVFAVAVTNGHNTSQGGKIPESIVRRMQRWALGPEIDPWPQRLVNWLRGPRLKSTLRQFYRWLRCSRELYRGPSFDDNLAVGWFTSAVPSNPVADGCAFVMHAAEGENGELRVRTGDHCLPATRGVQNLQIFYLVALRERGAIYYAAAMDGAHGVAAIPNMRPIAIDAFNDDDTLYAGVHQSALGQIGFRVDTRVQGVHVDRLPEFASPLATAHAGDNLTGEGALGAAPRGGNWKVLAGDVRQGATGVTSVGARNAICVLDPGTRSGLIHTLVELDGTKGAAGLVWQAADAANYWMLRASHEECVLACVVDGKENQVAIDDRQQLVPGRAHALQVLIAEGRLSCYLDGRHIFADWLDNSALTDATGVGISLGAGARLRAFEAHAFEVPLPDSIRFQPSWARRGDTVERTDDFARTGELAGSRCEVGDARWEKTLGRGSLVCSNGAARVDATKAMPNPGRTFHTLPWVQPDFADLEVTITPPGTGRDQGEKCRCGLVFWQDDHNYLSFTAYLDDDYRGASLALFTKRHGFEELYDAIWTMVWDKITWGEPFRLRVAFDGSHFVMFIDDEPVLQRALSDIYPDDPPLRIERVGLAVNWEWGDDTGSRFQSFVARR
jgi:hypothetical protein